MSNAKDNPRDDDGRLRPWTVKKIHERFVGGELLRSLEIEFGLKATELGTLLQSLSRRYALERAIRYDHVCCKLLQVIEDHADAAVNGTVTPANHKTIDGYSDLLHKLFMQAQAWEKESPTRPKKAVRRDKRGKITGDGPEEPAMEDGLPSAGLGPDDLIPDFEEE